MTSIDQSAPSVSAEIPSLPSTSARKPVVQARAKRTRAKILDQARVAFAELGFDAASLTSDILRPAGVSVGSFYHQFDNKEAVLLALVSEGLAARRERVGRLTREAGATSVGAAIETTAVALLDDVDAAPDLWRIQYREQEHPNPAIRRAVDAGWRPWSAVAVEIISTFYPGAPARRVDAAARTVVIGVAALVREYVAADADERVEIRAELVPILVAFCVAGLEAVLAPAQAH